MPAYKRGEVLLAWLVFSDGQGAKRRPVLVIHDFGDDDLLVVPITSQHARVQTDLILPNWKNAGLKLPSIVRVEKLATIAKSSVGRFRRLNRTGSRKPWILFSSRFSSKRNGA